MSMNDLFSAGGGKPKLVTLLVSGTGTYVPTADNARCFVQVQAGGGSGCTTLCGGGGGAMVEGIVRVPIAGLPYVVGAGGAAVTVNSGNAGSKSQFGSIVASPGGGGFYSNAAQFNAGAGGYLVSANVSASSVSSTWNRVITGSNSGVSGGSGGYLTSQGGYAIGFSVPGATSSSTVTTSNEYGSIGTSTGVGGYAGGGDSYFGRGGNGHATTGPDGVGYGYGGGAAATTSGKGGGGCILIYDYGV